MELPELISTKVKDHFILSESTDHPYPTNVNVKPIDRRNKIPGPLLYFIMYGGYVIYVGSYETGKNDVRTDRWDKHIQTLTNRGTRVGYMAPSTQKMILSKLDNSNYDPEFKESIRNRFRDTGCVTTKRRLNFAFEYEDDFSDFENIYDIQFLHLPLSDSDLVLNKLERVFIGGFRAFNEEHGYPEITNTSLVNYKLTSDEWKQFQSYLKELNFGSRYNNGQK